MIPSSTRLSIVHLLAPAPFGGLESVVRALARGQLERGDRVHVMTVLSPPGDDHPFVESLSEAGVPVIAQVIPGRGYRRERAAVRDVLRSTGAEILHTHGYRPDVLDAPVAREMGVATVSTVHGFTGGGWKNRVYEWLQRRAYRKFDRVVAVSGKLGAELEACGVPRERIEVVRNAWAVDQPQVERATARQVLGIPPHEPVVGWIGRMSQEKAPDVMVRGLAQVRTAGLRLSMVGDGALRADVGRLAESMGVEHRIRWHGVVEDAGKFLRAFDAVVITSWTEGTPILLLEAMAAGVPLITTAVGGIPDVVTGEEAILVHPGDAEAIAHGIDYTLSNHLESSARAKAALARLGRDLAVQPWVQRYRDIYSSILKT